MQINNITKFVGIKEIIIKNVIEEKNSLILESQLKTKIKKCKYCNSSKIEVHDHRYQQIRDLPYKSKKVLIKIKKTRYNCRSCKKRFTPDYSFVSKKHQLTNRLKLEIINQIKNMKTSTDIAKEYFVSVNTVINLHSRIQFQRLELSFERTRKQEQNDMPKSMRIYFKRSKSLLSKPQQNLSSSEKEKVINMLEKNEMIRKAYFVKEAFYSYVNTSKDKEEAIYRIRGWIDNIQRECKKFYSDSIRAFVNWLDPIANSYSHSWTNGYVEGVNTKIKTLKRLTFGMKNFNRFRNRIIAISL